MISKYDDARDAGMTKQESVVEMMKTLGSATFLTSLTTAIGFITLMSSTIMPMKRFGIYTASGVLIAYLVTIFFLPAALSLSRRARIFSETKSPFFDWSARKLGMVAQYNERKKGWILLFSALLLGVSAWQMTELTVNGRVFDDVAEDTQVMQDQAWFSEQLVPILPLEILIQTGVEEGVLNPDLMRQIQETEDFLLGFPEIEKVSSGRTILSEVHELLNPSESFLTAASTPLLAQYLLLLEISGAEALEELFTFGYETVRVTALIEDAGSERINEIRADLGAHLAERYTDAEILVTGSTVLSADLVGKIVRSLMNSMALAIGLISVLMALLFRNIRMVMISLIPNLLPLIVTGATMAIFNVDIKPSTAVIFTIAFGIAVDDSIHFLARFRVELARGLEIHEALTVAIQKTGRAIIITSMILLAGFGTLISSDFVSTAMMGVMVSATIFSALIADLLLLPALFHWLEPDLKHLQGTRLDSDATA
jgi:predicted RND superfamily exporter protein